jgi:ketosteroid isomerase-like protein
MATGENAAVVRRAYGAFNTADMDALIETFDESASWHTPGRGSFSGDRENRDATLAFFGRLGEETGGTFRATLRHLAEDDDGLVVGIQTSTGDRAGKHLEVGNCIVFELKDGRITDGREHFEDLYACDEFWS